MKKSYRIIFLLPLAIVSFAAALLLLGLALLTALEYRPKDREDAAVAGNAQRQLAPKQEIKILSWNIGYADLADYADFFMDGGKHVQNSSPSQIHQNLEAFVKNINDLKPDAVLLQEVDLCAKRSHRINQVEFISSAMKEFSYSFAYNFKAAFVPFPLPPIGHVESGLLTLSSFRVSSAQRISLFVPFKWPVRIANLKRCLLVNRIPVTAEGENGKKELVLVNLHLEAFDSGEGKIKQTKILRDFMQAEYQKGNYVIAGGDFNQTFSNSDISSYYQKPNGWKPGRLNLADFPQGWTLLQDPSIPTCRSNGLVYRGAEKSTFQFFCIDGFILSPNVSVSSVKTIDLDFAHSDHNPVLLTCSLK
ncbi:MAG: endonuclease/exonuclease/phosphatase family protein [Treponema sp.]|nr:endonuclease/exonuclease/phosphatase family protein [Treponema sp.]